jgi:hypothetical protein
MVQLVNKVKLVSVVIQVIRAYRGQLVQMDLQANKVPEARMVKMVAPVCKVQQDLKELPVKMVLQVNKVLMVRRVIQDYRAPGD